jgi:hypothetical protein
MFSYKTIALLIISVVVALTSMTTASNLRPATDSAESEQEDFAPARRSLIGLEDCGDRCKCSNDGIDAEDGRIILFSLVKTAPIPLCVDKDFAQILAGFLPMLYSCAKIVKDSAQSSGDCVTPVNGDNED